MSRFYRFSLQRTAGGESAEENVKAEWASEGDRKRRISFRVWKTERGLSVNKRRRMLVRKEWVRKRTKRGGTAGISEYLSRQSDDCRAVF